MNYLYVQVLLKKKTTLFLLLHNNVSGSNTHESQYIFIKWWLKFFHHMMGFCLELKWKRGVCDEL